MRHAGQGTFGQTNGAWIDILNPAGCTKNCDPTVFFQALERSYPGGAMAGDLSSQLGSQEELREGLIQSLVVEDYPLHFFSDGTAQIAYIHYIGALGEPWSVDVTFHLTFEPGTIHVGQMKKALALTGYDLEIITFNAHELVVKLSRQSSGDALPDERMTFLEIPLLAVPGKTPPATLPRIELTVER